MIKSKTYLLTFTFFYVLFLVVSAGCSSSGTTLEIPDKRIVNRTLTKEEMAIPAFPYQVGVNMERNRQVGYPSLREKPKIQWAVKNVREASSFSVLVDSESCTWYPQGEKFSIQDTLIRLDPGGFEILRKKVLANKRNGKIRNAEIYPVIMCEKALVCVYYYQTEEQVFKKGEIPMSLLCFDLSGKIVWKSELFNSDANTHPFRIFDDRIFVPRDWGKNDLQILRLTDGEISEQFESANWCNGIYSYGPLYMDDGGFISYFPIKKNEFTFARFNSDNSIKWKTETFDDWGYDAPVLLSDGSVIFTTKGYIASVDAETGKLNWDNNRYERYCVKGVDQEGDLLVFHNLEQEYRLSKFDKTGSITNSIVVNHLDAFSEGGLVIFNDGNYLFGHDNGITLANDNGTIWTINNKEFGYPEVRRMTFWNLNPTPDGRIVVSFTVYGDDSADGTQIFSLG
jgi:hypothetical protein